MCSPHKFCLGFATESDALIQGELEKLLPQCIAGLTDMKFLQVRGGILGESAF